VMPLPDLARCLAATVLAFGPVTLPPTAVASAPAPQPPARPVPARVAPTLVTPTAAAAVAGVAGAASRPAMVGGLSGGWCPAGGVEVDLAGSGDTAVVSGHAAAAACRAASGSHAARSGPRPSWTYEIACSPDQVRATEGLCSATPCHDGLFFAFRTLHRPDGGTEAAGYSCVALDRATAGPTLTAADVFAAVRRVKLPPGAIRITPSGRGLANVPSRLWLVGDTQAPVNLPMAGSTVHAEFQPVRYRWTIGPGDISDKDSGHTGAEGSGDGARGTGGDGADAPGGAVLTVPATADSSGRDGEAEIEFPGRGDFVVSVVTTWSAAAFLDGRYVGQVDGLESTTRIAYPVAELRAVLS
jgi:hypothetical protein